MISPRQFYYVQNLGHQPPGLNLPPSPGQQNVVEKQTRVTFDICGYIPEFSAGINVNDLRGSQKEAVLV